MPECSKKYKKTTVSFWNYCRDEPNEESTGGANDAIKYLIRNSKSFDYKISITGTLEGDNTEKKAEIVAPLKHLSNFWSTLDMSLINCEINLILTWCENCVLTSKAQRDKFIGADSKENPQFCEINDPTNATFKITAQQTFALMKTS